MLYDPPNFPVFDEPTMENVARTGQEAPGLRV